MGWKERAKAYSRGEGKRAHDDGFAARKLLRGIGWAESKIEPLCSMLGLEPEPSQSLLEIAVDILDLVSRGMFRRDSPGAKFMIDVRDVKTTKKFWESAKAEDMVGLAASLPEGNALIILSEIQRDDGPQSIAHVLLNDGGDVKATPDWLLKPVSTLAARCGIVAVWRRETTELIRDMSECMDWDIPERTKEDQNA